MVLDPMSSVSRPTSPEKLVHLFSLGKQSLERWRVLLEREVSYFMGPDGNAEIKREPSNFPLAILTQAP